MQKFLYLFLVVFLSVHATGQKLWQKKGYSLRYPVCYGSNTVEKAFVPPPVNFKSIEKQSEIIVSYSLFPPEARKAFEYAVGIWERVIDSQVPIYIQANWRSQDENVLGSCGPSDFEKDFDGAPHVNTYYPIALAEKIQNVELTGPDRPDMVAEFNKDINWYFGLDGDTPTMMYDFVSVVLHEVGHGLGFTGFFNAIDLTAGYSWFDWGDATSFDQLVINSQYEQLIDSTLFENPSIDLKDQLTSDSLFANSPVARAAGRGFNPRLYAPPEWDEGSSIYHLNDATYPPGTINTLMTHAYGRGEATHHPGPVTLGILADLGWKTMRIVHVPLKDQETFDPLIFEVAITSDYPVDQSSLYVFFSTDSFATRTDSIPLLPVDSSVFATSLLVEPGTESLQYFISAADSMNRVFTDPANAPTDFYVVNLGPDDILPAISHEPITFFFDTGDALIFTARVEDNLGVDTVFVEYSINGSEQPPFGLARDSGAWFSGVFPAESDQLDDKDEISYYIVATDASSQANTTRYPLNNTLSFLVEKMFEPVTSYSNAFESYRNDFVLQEFDIYMDEGFENNALHSPHPYPSPGEDDMEFNFITILKHPVVLQENASMNFDEVVLVEPGNNGTNFGDFEFWDYVIVEGSKDKGESWLPLADGYDSRLNASWEESFYSSIADMNSTTVGSADLYINHQINLLENGNFSPGDTLLIRFRLYSDPYAYGWGWAIDNLQIQTPATSAPLVLSPGNIRIYPNPFTRSFKVITQSDDVLDLLQYEVYTMHGQKIKTLQLKNVTGQISSEITLENSNPGIYLLLVKENGKQVLSKKIIHN